MKNDLLCFDESDIVYTRMQAIIWAHSGLLSPNRIQKSAIDALINIFENYSRKKTLVINCKRVNEINEKVLDNFLPKLRKSKRNVIFTQFKTTDTFSDNDLGSKLTSILTRNKIPFHFDDNKIFIGEDDKLSGLNMTNVIEEIENKYMFETIKSSYERYEDGKKQLVSTSIIAEGEFDAARIISNPKSFIWISMFLADKLDQVKSKIEAQNEKTGIINYSEIKLLAVSLKGSPFAAAVGLLTNTGYDTIDHLGPKHKLFDIEILSDMKMTDILYIYIGDFVAGGTELKIAQTYTHLLDCKLEHAIVIGSLFHKDVFSHHFELHPLSYLRSLDIYPNLIYELPLKENLP